MFRLDSKETVRRLSAFNQRWRRRRRILSRTLPSCWAPGEKVSPEIRGLYEAQLPIAEFARGLCWVGETLLPHPSWIPRILRCGGYHLRFASPLLSLPDFWRILPDEFAGRVSFEIDELPALFCALADPSRFGTAAGRYPGQREKIVESFGARPVRLLDLGCGIGLGTLEIASCLRCLDCVGVTLEPLEAWMGRNRCCPHDVRRERQFATFAEQSALFLCGEATAPAVRGQFDVIVCNGLAGGRFLHADSALSALLGACRVRLTPGGALFAANCFHSGADKALLRLREIACGRGWEVEGELRDLTFRRSLPGLPSAL